MGPQGPPGSGGASCKLVNKREFEFEVSHYTFETTIYQNMLPPTILDVTDDSL